MASVESFEEVSGFVAAMAHRFEKSGLDFDDLFQEGWGVYDKCREAFDPSRKKGSSFRTLLYRSLVNRFNLLLRKEALWRSHTRGIVGCTSESSRKFARLFRFAEEDDPGDEVEYRDALDVCEAVLSEAARTVLNLKLHEYPVRVPKVALQKRFGWSPYRARKVVGELEDTVRQVFQLTEAV